ncbi:hypothetical protein [Ensifer sesbaniae]|uniref:hypothetical protein n=1 Tax=Ensifer sesbaniae TaxID=1214071 RepID=UPI0015698761|nr:hypothetical protein [Ensifer sesbaniae]NRQ18767.1 hypothetical protein [Ensifer sesbaniae]
MKITNIRRLDAPPSARGFRALMTFNLAITTEIVLYDLQLVQAPDGAHLVYPSNTYNGSPTASFSPAVRGQIADLAIIEYRSHNDQHSNVRSAA